MSTTAVKALFDLLPWAEPDSRVSLPSADSGRTLEERISTLWDGLLQTGAAECPVCRGPMERAGHGGQCLRCGSVLS
jgi:hypothetical protein